MSINEETPDTMSGLSLKLPPDLKARLDAQHGRMCAAARSAGLEVPTYSSAVRTAIAKGLDELEKNGGR